MDNNEENTNLGTDLDDSSLGTGGNDSVEDNPADTDAGSSDNSSVDGTNVDNNQPEGMASSGRDAFQRGLSNGYNQRLGAAKKRYNDAKNEESVGDKLKRGHQGEVKGVDPDTGKANFRDKNVFDKLGDKANTLKAGADLLGTKIDSARSKSFAATHPGEALKMAAAHKAEMLKKEAKKRVLMWVGGIILANLPIILAIFGGIIVVLIVLGVITVDVSGATGSTCTTLPTVSSICDSITVDGVTLSVDEYVAGVIEAEVGGFSGTEAKKAISVAARSYALKNATKSANKCSVPNGEHFQAYKTPSQNSIDIANATSGMIIVDADNSVVSTEYDSILLVEPANDNNATVTVMQQNLEIPLEWVKSNVTTCKESIYNNPKDGGYGCGHGRGMSQYGALYLETEKNYTFEQILDYFYGPAGYKLASTNSSSSSCGSSFNGNFVSLSSYTLDHDGLNVLDRKLTDSEINSLNNYINSEVDKAGYGTGAGVAAAGQSLVYGFEQMGYYLQYYWGGGQGLGEVNNTFIGVNPKWGSTEFGDDEDSGNEHKRPYYGMDCSGFVSWSVRTACAPKSSSRMAIDWAGLPGVKTISLSDAKPGDVISWSSHVQLVIKNNGDGTVIVAEETGAPTSGLVFTKVSSLSSGKAVRDMSTWYQNNCQSSR